MNEAVQKLEKLEVRPGERRTVVLDHPVNTALVFDTKEAPQVMPAFWADLDIDTGHVNLHTLTFISLQALSPELQSQVQAYLKEHPLKQDDYRQAPL